MPLHGSCLWVFELDFFAKAMNTIQKGNGLPARQQTMYYPAPAALKVGCFFSAITLCIAALAIGVVATSCSQDTRGQDTANLKKSSAPPDTVGKPDVNIQVNRRFDDKGNLIGFDSTYSSYYSNVNGDTLHMDSLMKSFDTYFDRHHSRLFDRQFNTLFFKDSTRYPDFFHDDFFMKRYELNDLYLRGMMQRMDSIKNQFYNDAHRSGNGKDKT
jgi:hypothetical protein